MEGIALECRGSPSSLLLTQLKKIFIFEGGLADFLHHFVQDAMILSFSIFLLPPLSLSSQQYEIAESDGQDSILVSLVALARAIREAEVFSAQQEPRKKVL
jgi:hypothetical protein